MIDPYEKALAALNTLGESLFYDQSIEEAIESLKHLCADESDPVHAMRRTSWDDLVDHMDYVLKNCDDATLNELMEKYFGLYSNRYIGGGRAFFQMVQQVMIDALADRRSKF